MAARKLFLEKYHFDKIQVGLLNVYNSIECLKEGLYSE